MTTKTGRQFNSQQTHYLRKAFDYTRSGTQIFMGTLPTGAIVTGGRVAVTTAFNDSGSDLADVGTVADAQAFASSLDVSAVGEQDLDELTTTKNKFGPMTSETDVYVKYTGQNANASAGQGYAIVYFIPDNDG